MIFGIVGVMEIDVVAEELTAYWIVAELVCISVCANDMTKCVATAVMRNSGSSGRSRDTVWNMTASSGFRSQFITCSVIRRAIFLWPISSPDHVINADGVLGTHKGQTRPRGRKRS